MRQSIYIFKLTVLFSIVFINMNALSIAESGQIKSESQLSSEHLVNQANKIVNAYTKPGWFAGNLVIFKGDKIIYDKSFGLADIKNNVANSASTKIRVGSINKHFTATLVMQKVQSGQISLDDSLAKFELGFARSVAEKITIRQLLNHTSGFADIFNKEYFKTYKSLKNIKDKLPLLIDKPLISEPGKEYNYSNYGYIVLGAILEKIEKKSFQQIIQNNILNVIKLQNTDYALTENVNNKARSYHFSPLGLKVDRTDMLENITPDGGMYSTAYDLATFYSKLLYSNELLNDSSKALMANGYKSSSSPWTKILNSQKAQWSSYGGGPGVSAAVDILIKDKLMVIALANTDNLVAERITQRIIDAYKGVEVSKIMLPIAVYANNLIKEKGNDYFINNAKTIFTKAGYKQYSARPLNKLGHAFLKNNELERALTVFLVNSKLFPKEPNTFDSLAFAYEKSGDNKNALLNYRTALTLDPNFESAKNALQRLGAN